MQNRSHPQEKKIGIPRLMARSSTIFNTQGTVDEDAMDEEAMDKEREECENSPKKKPQLLDIFKP